MAAMVQSQNMVSGSHLGGEEVPASSAVLKSMQQYHGPALWVTPVQVMKAQAGNLYMVVS